MKVAFQKWGNSLALRVPKAFADEIGASDGKAAEMTVSDGKLVIERTTDGTTVKSVYRKVS